jgi:acyl carrier protein
MNESLEKITKILQENNLNLDISTIKPDSKLSDLGVDSLGLVQMIFEIEESLGITLSDKDLENLKTVDDIMNLFKKNQKE